MGILAWAMLHGLAAVACCLAVPMQPVRPWLKLCTGSHVGVQSPDQQQWQPSGVCTVDSVYLFEAGGGPQDPACSNAI